MRHHSDSDPHDALNDYLDSLAEAPPPRFRAVNFDPSRRDGVDRFFDLAKRAGMTSSDTRRPTMQATLPASTPLAPPRRKTLRDATLPAWTKHVHLVSTGLLFVAVITLTFAAFGPNGIGNSGTGSDGPGNEPNLNRAVPIATVPDDAETSSIPYSGPETCTVEPMSREEIIAHILGANVATEPKYQMYERPVEPSDEEVQAIIQVFDEWRACQLDTPATGMAYELRFQTPWYTANQLPVFYNYQQGRIERPISEEEIVKYVDLVLRPEQAATPPVEFGTPPPPHEEEIPEFLPIPDGATPVASEVRGGASPTVFAEDLIITGPDTAIAQAYFVHEDTREVMPTTPLTYRFAKVDGQWLIDSYSEGSRG